MKKQKQEANLYLNNAHDNLTQVNKIKKRIRVSNFNLKNGAKYSGQMNNGVLDGQGFIHYPNGQRYEGSFHNGMKNGKGKYYYKNGQYFIGDWVNNKKEGVGIYFYGETKRYEGQFKNNMKHGKGKIIQQNGNFYIGNFYENQKDQEGQYFDAVNKKRLKFLFEKGKQISCVQVKPDPNDFVSISSIKTEEKIVSTDQLVRQIVSTYIKVQSGVSPGPKDHTYASLHLEASNGEFITKLSDNADSARTIQFLKNENLIQKKINEWQINDVCEWLQQIFFSDYEEEFRFEKINGESLLCLNQNDLKELSVANISDRKILLREIEFLKLLFKSQCLDQRIAKLQNLQLSWQLIRKLQQLQIKAKLSLQHIPQRPSHEEKSLSHPLAEEESSSDSSSSTSQELKHIQRKISNENGTEKGKQKQKQKRNKSTRTKGYKISIQRRVQMLLKQKGIYIKFIIPREEIQIIKTIGKGGYGQVFLANWLGQNVAIKKYIKTKGFRNRHISHFIQEVQIINKLLHPNIVLYMGMFIQNNQYSIVMEYLPGGSIFDYIHKKGYKPCESRIFNFCKDIALGMAYLHGKNILHCDLKSSNVLIGENWTAKISDFGLSQAKRNNEKNQRKNMALKLGTPQWMAPQVLRNQKYQYASDVYSFGIILWQLLTCEIPFKQFGEKQVVQIVKLNKKSPIIVPDHPNQYFVNLFKLCTNRQPNKRLTFKQIVQYLQQEEENYTANKVRSKDDKEKKKT